MKKISLLKYFLALTLVLLLATLSVCLAAAGQKKISRVIINKTIVKVELADTPIKQYQGLSGRQSLCSNCGMLFVFSQKTPRDFVMRRMNFPLDILWISGSKIVKINKHLPPEGINYKKIYSSGASVDYVLEVNAGFAAQHKITVGDKINFQ